MFIDDQYIDGEGFETISLSRAQYSPVFYHEATGLLFL